MKSTSLIHAAAAAFTLVASTGVAAAQQMPGAPALQEARVVSIQGCGLRWLDAYEDASQDYHVVHWAPQNNDTQRWLMVPAGNGFYRFMQVSSSRFLDAHEVAAMGFRLVTRPFQQDHTQLWRVSEFGGNFFTLQQASNGRFVDCSPGQPALFTNAQGGANTQTWRFGDAGPSLPIPPPAMASGQVIRTGAGLCLDVHAPDMAKNGGRVQVWNCSGQPQQLWTYDRATSAIRVSSGLCLDVHAAEMTMNGGRVQVWACNGQVQQQWTPMPGGAIRSNRAGLCLDVHAPDQAINGGRVQVWQCSGAQQQRFTSNGF